MLKKKYLYYFNDGYDGIVVAKSLKHAVNILAKNGYQDMKNDILKALRTGDDTDWCVEVIPTIRFKKSRMLGWLD